MASIDPTRVRRFDRGQISKAEKTPDGFLRTPAFIARTGIYLYADANGTITRELRRPEQVFDPESLRSFSLVPVTDGHPVEGYVDALSASRYQRGSLGENVERDGEMVRAPMMITGADLVKKILDGEAVECSCGYTCEVVTGGGLYDGQPYDTEQTKIRGNHVAIVPAGRAGPAARVKLDAGDAIALPAEADTRTTRDDTRTEESPMEREITINGMKFKLPAVVCDAIEAQARTDAASTKARIDAAEGMKTCPECGAKCAADAKKCDKCGHVFGGKADALAAAQAKADALTAEVAKLKTDAEAVTKAQPKLVADALEVVDVARRAGVEVKIDALDLPALRRAVAEKVNGVSLEGKADAYVAASFDIARVKVDATATGAGLLGAPPPAGGEKREDAETARAAMAKRNADAWKTK
jgi:hypothetical protein